MTSLDEYDLFSPPLTEDRVVPTPRRHRHVWEPRLTFLEAESDHANGYYLREFVCRFCRILRDEEKARRGKSSRRLGHDGERRSEKRYGLQKIGERGEITDLRGTVWKAQQKTSRRTVPVTWRAIFSQLDATRDGREAAIIFSFVRTGLPTQDFWLVRGETILSMLGRDEPGGA